MAAALFRGRGAGLDPGDRGFDQPINHIPQCFLVCRSVFPCLPVCRNLLVRACSPLDDSPGVLDLVLATEVLHVLTQKIEQFLG